MSQEHLNERLVVLLTPSEKDILKELAYLRRKNMGQLTRDLIRDEIIQSGIVAPKPTETDEEELLKRVP
jgi:hypothetical protein